MICPFENNIETPFRSNRNVILTNAITRTILNLSVFGESMFIQSKSANTKLSTIRYTTIMNTAILSILSGIGGMFGWGIYDFLGGVYAKQIGPVKSFFWSQLAGLISICLLLCVFLH